MMSQRERKVESGDESGAGGYDCEFVDRPPYELETECSICLHVLRDSHLISCCWHNFCRSCIVGATRQLEPCPLCRSTMYVVVSNKSLQKSLESLEVFCSFRELGCEWIGELGKLDQHLNYSPQPGLHLEGCQLAEIKCLDCAKRVKRQDIACHLKERCLNRPCSCEYCKEFESTFVGVQNHYAICKCYPLPCPNKCAPSSFERRNLDHHLQDECPLTVVPCELHRAGCGVALPRKDMAAHLKEDAITHISLLAAENLRLSRRLTEEKEETQETVRLLVQENTELRRSICQQQQANCDLAGRVAEMRDELSIIPVSLKVSGISRRACSRGGSWKSCPFYTHPCGYKMVLAVEIAETKPFCWYVKVYLHLLHGEYDTHLKWPFRGEITVELKNQQQDDRHRAVTITYSDETDGYYAGPVPVCADMTGGWGCSIIAASMMASRNCHYIKDNIVLFQIKSVVIH